MATASDPALRTLAGVLLALGTAVHAAPPGRPAPTDCAALAAGGFSVLPMLQPAGGGGRGPAAYCLANLRAEAVAVYAPEGRTGFPEGLSVKAADSPRVLPARSGGFRVAPLGVGNYHWLQAREETPEGVVSAATVHYFANPGPAPTALLARPKAELEIVPQPLPREHWRYRSGETWAFLVRFRGRPLPGAKLRLETSGGTQQVFGADEAGVVRVTFPDDIRTDPRPARGGHAHGRGGENRFVLAVGHTDPQGRYYLSGFNYRYSGPATEGKSGLAGAGFLLLGGLVGLPLVLHRRKETVHG